MTPTPVPLNTNAGTDSGPDFSAQIATDGSGNWVAVWGSQDSLGGTIGIDNDVLVARSTDNGKTWTYPAALNNNAASDSRTDFLPALATDGLGKWIAVWASNENLGGTIGEEFDILVSRSTDEGETWSDPAPLNSHAPTDADAGIDDEDEWPHIATDGAGNWVTVWHSNANLGGALGSDRDILVSRSADGGTTWSESAPLNSNATTDSRGDDFPHVATDGSGNWITVWQSGDDLGGTIGNDSDILTARSTDNGETWTPVATLNTDAATDSEGDGLAYVTTDGAGRWVAVWVTGEQEDLAVARSEDAGATWTDPAMLKTDPPSAPTIAWEDTQPHVTTDGSGNWITVWRSRDDLGGTIGVDEDILVSHSTDDGATWTDARPLNTNASGDSGTDSTPQIATDGNGNWVAVWDSNDDLGGTTGTDYDILFTNCSPLDSECDGVPDPPAVGGIVELQTNSDAPSERSASSGALPLPASVALGLLVIGAGGLYVVRMRRG